jgi:hypothetical protein
MAATDLFATYVRTPAPPADDAFPVTPSDTTAFSQVASALFVGGAGTVTVITNLGNTVLFTGVLAGMILPIRCSQVKQTGTSATNITALV